MNNYRPRTNHLVKVSLSNIYYSVSKCETRCQLIKGIAFQFADFIGLFNFEWHNQKVVGIIGISVLLRDREKNLN